MASTESSCGSPRRSPELTSKPWAATARASSWRSFEGPVRDMNAHARLAEREHRCASRASRTDHHGALAFQLERFGQRPGGAPGVGVEANEHAAIVDDGVHRADPRGDRVDPVEQGKDRELERHRDAQAADPQGAHAGERPGQVGLGDREWHVDEAHAERLVPGAVHRRADGNRVQRQGPAQGDGSSFTHPEQRSAARRPEAPRISVRAAPPFVQLSRGAIVL